MIDYKSALLSLIFVSNLSLGSTGTDVVTLQQYLVEKGYLEIPAGVPYGYFGPLTKSALAKWQSANGISPAVGYFGPISRVAITAQSTTLVTNSAPLTSAPPASSSPSSFPKVENDTPSAPGMRVNRVMLFRTTPFEARPGDSITLDGSGFSKTHNEIYFNSGNMLIATSTNGTILKISVPINLSEGEYNLSIKNSLGTSDPQIKISIKITNNPQPAPTITNASIAGDIVTLTGSGFTSSSIIISTFGNFSSPVSSSGTTISFSITNLSQYNQIKQFTGDKTYPTELWIYVQNEHGINKDPYKLEITI